MKRYAFYLFTQHKFEESLKYYLEIKEGIVITQQVSNRFCVYDMYMYNYVHMYSTLANVLYMYMYVVESLDLFMNQKGSSHGG